MKKTLPLRQVLPFERCFQLGKVFSLTVLHSERPKLQTILAFLSAVPTGSHKNVSLDKNDGKTGGVLFHPNYRCYKILFSRDRTYLSNK